MRPSLILILFTLLSATAAADNESRSVSVSGKASVSAEPDLAQLQLGVEARDTDLDAARERVTRVTAEFLKLGDKLGIAENRIQSTGLILRPEYRWNPDGRERELLGYLVQRQLSVQLDDLQLLGPLIEAAVDSGVNLVSPPVLDSSRRDALYREALAAAARDARDNAEALAAALDASVGPVQSLRAEQYPRPPAPMMMRAEAATMQAPDSYQPGQIRIEAQVQASFDLITE